MARRPKTKTNTDKSRSKGEMMGGKSSRREHGNKSWLAKPGGVQSEERFQLKHKDSYMLYGRNSVEAALKNENRECVRLFATQKAMTNLEPLMRIHKVQAHRINEVSAFENLIPRDAPHQGLFLETRPLPGSALEYLTPIEGRRNIILMLDQVTDPHNVGACLRSAAAFGTRAVITQDRNSPDESGVLARASAGGLEITPWVRAANLTQALETLKDMGYWHVGLDSQTDTDLKNIDMGDNIVIVMGSEGSGLRPLVRKNCDMIAKIPMPGTMESLNVSNAAAIALYQLSS